MKLNELLAELSQRKVKLWVENGQLGIAAPKGVLTPELRQALGEKKPEILAFLQNSTSVAQSNYTPITPVEGNQDIPLSYAQERLWLLDQLVPGNTGYNLFLAYHLEGELSLEALEKSLIEIQQRHEILRTQFVEKNGATFQVVSDNNPGKLEVEDLRNQQNPNTEAFWQELATKTLQESYDLKKLPLWRLKVIRLTDVQNILLLTMHHIVTDGTSLKLFMEELSALYGTYINNSSSSLSSLPLQYKDYAAWQREWLKGQLLESQLSYWEKHLAQATSLKLPTSFQPPAIQTYRAERQSFKIPQKLVQSIKTVANQENVTLFVVLLASFGVLLNKYTEQEKLILCSPVVGRNQSELDKLIGYFNNLLPLEVNCEGNPTLQEILARLRATTIEAYENQDVPFQKIAELPNLANVNLSKALFALQNAPSQGLNLPGIIKKSLDLSKGMTDFDLSFFIEETGESLTGEVIYKTDIFSPKIIFEMVENYQSLLESLVVNPKQLTSSLPKLKLPEVEQLTYKESYQGNSYVGPRNEVETQLTAIWEQVLNISPIGVQDHFFHTLNGSSILAFRLFSEIDKAFKKNLPLATLIKSPTIEKLAIVLSEDKSDCSWRSLVGIKTAGTNPILFCVHPVGGNVLGYLDLANCLSPNQPFYGLQIKGLDGIIPESYNVLEMAEDYLKEIQTLQPHGPYYLAGHSGGGIIAFEMAQKLLARGEKVALLAMFDTYNPIYVLKTREEDLKYFQQQTAAQRINFKLRTLLYKLSLNWLNPIKQTIKGLFNKESKDISIFLRKKFKKLLDRYQTQQELKNYKQSDNPNKPLPYSLREQVITQRLGDGIITYKPQTYQGKITLFSTYTSRFRVSNIPDDKDRGWKDIPTDGLEIYDVKGDHYNLLVYPTVVELASKLQDSIDKAAKNYQATSTR